MKTWIKLAIENGAALTIYRDSEKYNARICFMDTKTVSVAGATLNESLKFLNETLQDDAADEINLRKPSSPIA